MDMLNFWLTGFLNPMLTRPRAERSELVKDNSGMATVAKDVQAARKGDRRRVLMRGTVFGPDGAHVVWIRDISKDGALVSGDDCLPSDCDVIFKRGPIFAAGHIAWSNETGAGVKFYRDLAACDVATAALPLPNRDD
jgi:hypothetical protein